MDNEWFLVAIISMVVNVILICVIVSVRANAKYCQRVLEQRIRVFDDWVDTVLKDQSDRKSVDKKSQ